MYMSETNREKLQRVYTILQKKGYDPVNQVEGFLISGDPTYITSSDGARKLVAGMDTELLLHEIVQYYFSQH